MTEKPFVPTGMTEDEVTMIIEKVAHAVASRYVFGYHDVTDIQSQAKLIAITILTNGKFKPRGEKPLDKQLTNFLYVWLKNRLWNYRRDNSSRSTNVDKEPNKSKYNLMHALKIGSYQLEDSEMFAFSEDVCGTLDTKHALEYLLNNFSAYKRNLWNKMTAGEDISRKKRQMMVDYIRKQLRQYYPEQHND